MGTGHGTCAQGAEHGRGEEALGLRVDDGVWGFSSCSDMSSNVMPLGYSRIRAERKDSAAS